MLFLPLVLLPEIKNNSDRTILIHRTGVKFRFYGWIALIGLLVTGAYNMYIKGMPFSWEFLVENNYGRILGIKLLAFAVMILMGGIHDFYIGNKAIEQMQQNDSGRLKLIARWSGRINLLLALIIACLGVTLSRGGI